MLIEEIYTKTVPIELTVTENLTFHKFRYIDFQSNTLCKIGLDQNSSVISKIKLKSSNSESIFENFIKVKCPRKANRI